MCEWLSMCHLCFSQCPCVSLLVQVTLHVYLSTCVFHYVFLCPWVSLCVFVWICEFLYMHECLPVYHWMAFCVSLLVPVCISASCGVSVCSRMYIACSGVSVCSCMYICLFRCICVFPYVSLPARVYHCMLECLAARLCVCFSAGVCVYFCSVNEKHG